MWSPGIPHYYSNYSIIHGMTSQRKSRFMLLTRHSIFHERARMRRKSFRLCSGGSLWSREALQGWNIHFPVWAWLRFSLRCELNMYVTEDGEGETEKERQADANSDFWGRCRREDVNSRSFRETKIEKKVRCKRKVWLLKSKHEVFEDVY